MICSLSRSELAQILQSAYLKKSLAIVPNLAEPLICETFVNYSFYEVPFYSCETLCGRNFIK